MKHVFKLCKLCNVQIPNKCMPNFCDACCMGKAHRLSFISFTINFTKPFELVFGDLWGHFPVVFTRGRTYFLTCVDAYSRYTWTYPLKFKFHTLPTLVQFKALVELQLYLKFKSVQTDGGGAYTIDSFS